MANGTGEGSNGSSGGGRTKTNHGGKYGGGPG